MAADNFLSASQLLKRRSSNISMDKNGLAGSLHLSIGWDYGERGIFIPHGWQGNLQIGPPP